ncbi:MAG TPA: ABC transporter ATP-binding protein [Candidatus Goldiibacteriota bacterium]|nr:ABC transporter ATP-binding protein [Candidatus Goldiibacteriota bacterium]
MNDIMVIRDVRKSFITGKNQLNVLKNVNFEVNKGELLMLVGPSGAGKSTLLSIMGGISRPTMGKVILDNTDIYNLDDEKIAALRNRKMGFVFQFHHLLSEFSALENVIIPALIEDVKKKDAIEKAKKILIPLGLGGRLNHRPSELSGGEQQRVAIARAIINEPDIIFADEPTGNLDKQNAEIIHKIIIDLNKNFNQTFVIVTHNENLASYGHRIIYIDDGEIKDIKKNKIN